MRLVGVVALSLLETGGAAESCALSSIVLDLRLRCVSLRRSIAMLLIISNRWRRSLRMRVSALDILVSERADSSPMHSLMTTADASPLQFLPWRVDLARCVRHPPPHDEFSTLVSTEPCQASFESRILVAHRCFYADCAD